MRILIIDTYYPALLAEHYRQRPDLAQASYAEQLEELMSLRFGTSDAYSHALTGLGHEATELVANCPPLQRAWAREAGLRHPLALISRGRRAQRVALLMIAMSQVRAWRPDVVYVQDLWFFPRPVLTQLRGHARLIAGQIASPPPSRHTLRGYDLVVTSFPHFVRAFEALGVDSAYLPLAFDPRVLDALGARGVDASPSAERPIAAAFVGGVDARVHERGVRLLERAVQVSDLQIWGYGRETLPASSPLRARHHGEAWGLDMYEILARSRIVLNRHISAAAGHANNMRLYEATGTGALLVTDHGSNLAELFVPGGEVAVYDNESGLEELFQHFLQSEDEARAIAAAGQRRTLREHTYGHRVEKLVALLEARL